MSYRCTYFQDQPVIFGGYHGDGSEGHHNERDYYQDCFLITDHAKKMKMLEKRYRASSVRLDHPRSYQSTAWIVGGYGSKNSTTTTGKLHFIKPR